MYLIFNYHKEYFDVIYALVILVFVGCSSHISPFAKCNQSIDNEYLYALNDSLKLNVKFYGNYKLVNDEVEI